MTIGYILDDTLDRSDGVQQSTIGIGEYMRSLGHDVHYIVADTKRTDLQNIHSIGRSVSLQFNGNSVRTPRPVSKKAVTKLFQDVAFDVLHVQTPFSPFLASKVLNAAPPSVRKVSTFHILPYGVVASVGTKILGLLQRRTIHSLDVHYATSQPAKEFMERAYSVKGHVLGNPVDYDFFSSFKKRQSDRKKIVFVGRFEHRKGVGELVRAYKGLDRTLQDTCELVMVSKGPLLEETKEYALKNNLNVSFPGFISEEEKAQYLADADIAVFPSTSGESFGIVLVEAMAAGSRVTIGGDNPGYRSVLDAWPATLFDPTRIDEFTATLTHFLQDEEGVARIGSQQREDVKKYDIKVISQRLLDEAYTAS